MGRNIQRIFSFLLRAAAVSFIYGSVIVTAMNGDEMGSRFEGDIDLQGETMVKMDADKMVIMPRMQSRRWPSKVIPVAISPRFDERGREIIIGAMGEIATETCVKFTDHKHEDDYIYIQPGRACYSHVGRQGGRQNVTLRIAPFSKTNCLLHGEVMHELLHALGFWHEQSRRDRDKHITILTQNLLGRARDEDFMKRPDIRDHRLPYDYSSIMHYSKDAFQRNPTALTVVTKINGVAVGIRHQLSHFDKVKINRLFHCAKYH